MPRPMAQAVRETGMSSGRPLVVLQAGPRQPMRLRQSFSS